jgi:mannose-6-phosphate isomerase-like protein (cupin superfamily)
MVQHKAIAKHYNWGNQCDGWWLVESPTLTVIQERMPPHSSEIKHFHQIAQQFFYVLSGQATFDVNGQLYLVKPHEGIHIQPGSEHRIYNEQETDLDFLVISQPATQHDRYT